MAVNFASMLTKYTLTIGSTDYDIPDECLKNWDKISFSLKRTDYSGVMRSYSTEFVFVGDIKDLLWKLYLDEGFNASASVAVYTFTNRWGWTKQYEAPLDFSRIEMEHEQLSINALDNALASLLKAKKSQKYEYPVEDFTAHWINVGRIALMNSAVMDFVTENNIRSTAEWDCIDLRLNEESAVVSEAYIKPSSVEDSSNSFFAMCVQHGVDLSLDLEFKGTVRCYYCPYILDKNPDGTKGPSSSIDIGKFELWVDNQLNNASFVKLEDVAFNDELRWKKINGVMVDVLVRANAYSTLSDLQSDAETKYGMYIPNGAFGVVGSATGSTTAAYWTDNTVYEYNGRSWIAKGIPEQYFQDRKVDVKTTISASNLWNDTHIRLRVNNTMTFIGGTLTLTWSDPISSTISCIGVQPVELAQHLLDSITGGGTTVAITADSAGLLANTYILCGEALRRVSGAKVYTTWKDFCDWMEVVFGYTYSISGDTIMFLPRSSVFPGTVVKEIESFEDINYSVNDDLIYASVEVGYPKKEYGEIDGRYETNFTNYYETGYNTTDQKLSLSSKYRADRYGIEYTVRKGENKSTDDKADEDVFFVITSSGSYTPDDQNAFAPSVCVNNNKAYIAALGNGKAVSLTMTSSDGNNALNDIVIAAGEALFTAGEIEFSTDDMELPSDLNALVQLDYNGYRIKGFIKSAECRFGRLNGVDYKLIVKEIIEL